MIYLLFILWMFTISERNCWSSSLSGEISSLSDWFISESCHHMKTCVSLSNPVTAGAAITNTLIMKIPCIKIFPFYCKIHTQSV